MQGGTFKSEIKMLEKVNIVKILLHLWMYHLIKL